MAILSGQPRSANCISRSHLMVLKISRNDFWLLMEARSEIALGIIKVLVHNLEVINQRLQSQPAPTEVAPPLPVSSSVQPLVPASTLIETAPLQPDPVPLLPTAGEGLKTLTISTYTTDNPSQPETGRLKIRNGEPLSDPT